MDLSRILVVYHLLLTCFQVFQLAKSYLYWQRKPSAQLILVNRVTGSKIALKLLVVFLIVICINSYVKMKAAIGEFKMLE